MLHVRSHTFIAAATKKKFIQWPDTYLRMSNEEHFASDREMIYIERAK
jgi:hypothetical protein